MRLSDDFLLRIKDSNDIYEVVSSYVPLKRSGSDYVCCCPFHSEKTPSCHIYMATQSFYCFGCGAAGDVINFVRLYENLDYLESVRFLAQRAGIPMPEDGGDEGARVRTRMLEMNREAGKFFHQTLFSPEGKPGLDYLLGRGLTQRTIKIYGLGYAPEEWGRLKNHMNALGFNDEELAAASLLSRSQKNGRYYDYFRQRVMFPFFDVRGNIVGFSGRIIVSDDQGRKYFNTRDTPVYNKSRFLYSLNHAKNTKQGNLILCEGNLDVISLYQAGFKNAVATCGTAITDQHARVIANQGFTEVILSLDSDEAGQKATARAMNILSNVGIQTRILKIQNAKDPDEYVKKFGSDAFALLIDKSESGMDFELERLKAGIDLSTAQGKSEYLRKAVPFIASVGNTIDRAVYVSAAAKAAEVPIQTVELAVEQEDKRRRRSDERKERNDILSGAVQRDRINPEAVRYPAQVIAERGIIAFLIHSPDYLEKICSRLSPEDFPTEFNRKLYLEIVAAIGSGRAVNVTTLGENHTGEEISSIAKLIRENNQLPYSVERLNDYIKTLTEFAEKKKQKSAGEMTADELRKLADKIRSQKKG
ncbi:MAG: DNA primase [Eubacterium sp.]|nr:DNA primase [Eubacterium sp.]